MAYLLAVEHCAIGGAGRRNSRKETDHGAVPVGDWETSGVLVAVSPC